MDTGLTKEGLKEVNDIVSVAFKSLKKDFDKSFGLFLENDEKKWVNMNRFENEIYSHMKSIEKSIDKINIEKTLSSKTKSALYGFLGALLPTIAAAITIIYYIKSIVLISN